MTAYVCSNCRYRLDSNKVMRVCPYCSKPALAKEKSAEELLDSIEDN